MDTPPDAATVAAPHPQPVPIALPPPSRSLVREAARVLRGDPALLATVGYIALSLVGLWCSYWYYGRFGLPILEYLQASDFLVAGLRDPAYFLVLAGALLVVWLINWPERWRERNPQRIEALATRRWGRFLLYLVPRRRSFFGLHYETGLLLALIWCAMWMLTAYVTDKANRIRAGGGTEVRVTLAGAAAPLPESARLLGTTSGFVLLWWPQRKQAEAVAMENMGRLESVVSAPASPKARR